MHRTKRLALIFSSLVFLIASLCPAASAVEISPRASEYLDSYGAYLYQGSSKGSVRIDFTVSATRRSDYVGVSQINIYEADSTPVATIKGTVANGLLRADAIATMGSYTYYGESGETYYAVLTMYAERDGGSDSRKYNTNTCIVP